MSGLRAADGWCHLRGGPTRGFTVLEVMVAAILLGVLVVPLVTSALSALGAGDATRLRDGQLAAIAAVSGCGYAWEWGPRVESATWQPGPELEVTLGAMGEAEDVASLVGLWADGWFLGQRSPDTEGVLRLAASEWREIMGRELVIRVREPEGTWGPPWRTIVADRAADHPSVVEVDPIRMEGSQPTAPASTVAHQPAFANPAVHRGIAGPAVEVDPLDLLFFVNPGGSGRLDLSVGQEEVEGSTQSWYEEEGRALDVYF